MPKITTLSAPTVDINLQGKAVTLQTAILVKRQDTHLARWLTGRETPPRQDEQDRLFIDMPEQRFRYAAAYLALGHLPGVVQAHELKQLAQDVETLGAPGILCMQDDIARARQAAQSWWPGRLAPPTSDELCRQYVLSDLLWQTGARQESTAWFLLAAAVDDQPYDSNGVALYGGILAAAPNHVRALSRMGHLQCMHRDQPHQEALHPGRQALALAPSDGESVVLVARTLLLCKTKTPLFSRLGLTEATQEILAWCHATNDAATRPVILQQFMAAAERAGDFRAGLSLLRDADHVYIADFARWLGAQVDRAVLEQSKTGALHLQDRAALGTRVRACMTAWTSDPKVPSDVHAHAAYEPHMACVSMLKQMASAQEGFYFLHNYLDSAPDDVIAWATLAKMCLNQQVLQDSMASLMCEDDLAPRAKALRANRCAFDPDTVDAVVRFGSSGLALFDEGQAALLQALSRGQHEPRQVRRLVAQTLDAYADVMVETAVTHRGFVDREIDIQSIAHRFNAHLLQWAPSYRFEDDASERDDMG